MASPEPILMCCNAGVWVGFGHLMRVREMARHLSAEGHRCYLYGPEPDLTQPADKALFTDMLPETQAEADDAVLRARRVVALAAALGCRHVLIDDYRAEPAFQDVLAAAGLHWLQQFDNSRDWSYRAPVLVNASPFERPEHYTGRLPDPRTRFLFGPRYAVIRPEFRAIRPQPETRPCRRILLAFGGGDDRGMSQQMLRALSGHLPEGIEVLVISGPSNPRLGEITIAAARLPDPGARLLVNPSDMAALIASCDLGGVAGGTMGYELAICGVPTIFVALVANQERSCRGWQSLTGAPYLGRAGEIDDADLRMAVLELVGDTQRRAALAAAGRAAVDGQGTERLCAALLEKELA